MVRIVIRVFLKVDSQRFTKIVHPGTLGVYRPQCLQEVLRTLGLPEKRVSLNHHQKCKLVLRITVRRVVPGLDVLKVESTFCLLY